MPIKRATDAPPHGPSLIESTLGALRWNPIAPGGPQRARVRVRPDPLRLYYIQFDDARHGLDAGSLAAEPGGWLYLVTADPAPPARPDPVSGGVELLRPPFELPGVSPGQWAVGEVSAGPVFGRLAELVDHPPALPGGEFEPRILDVPALGVRAVWFHSADGWADRFCSFPDTDQTEFEPPTSAATFVNQVEALARQWPTEGHGRAMSI